MAGSHTSALFRFGEFEADTRTGELLKNGTRIPLQDQPFQVLAVLLQRPGELVRREELRQQVWPENTFVEFDHALNTAVKKIRIALGDCADAPSYIETIPKRGYRFIAAVHAIQNTSPPSTAESSRFDFPRWSAIKTGVVLCGIVLAVVLAILQVRHDSFTIAERPIVLAVLPIEDWSDEAQHGRLCDGITQELITQSARAEPKRLALVPRAASLPYRHTPKTVAEVARELHADYLMEGNLRGDAQHVRLTVELIRASDESRIWGDDFNHDTADSLALETELAASITGKLRQALFPAQTHAR